MVQGKELILRLILAIVLGGIIGVEREVRHRGAGLRTHILVCLTSSLIMLTSIYLFDIYKDNKSIDPTRIAGSVIAGVGFLCAGTIIRYGEGIRGLTTATSLWLVSGIGLAVGCGFYQVSLFVAGLALLVLLALRPIEKYLLKKEI